MTAPTSIFWFRQDLRLSDNPGLLEASKLGPVLLIYILDDLSQTPFKLGSTSKLFLHESLSFLNHSLNGLLNFYQGDPQTVILELIKTYPSVSHVFWNTVYEPFFLDYDTTLKKTLQAANVYSHTFNASLLFTPDSVSKLDGTYYKVFGAYKRKVLSIEPRSALPKASSLFPVKDLLNSLMLDTLCLIPDHPWAHSVRTYFEAGETAAFNRFHGFVQTHLSSYKRNRDYPSKSHTSSLSTALHFGEISPHQIWELISTEGHHFADLEDVEHYLSELIWREFSYYLLFHFPTLPFENFQPKFNTFPWTFDSALFQKWQKGQTGYPLVDAGMRELWQTGTMHNRVRMVVASFLVKNLGIYWHYGRDWFWDCLTDADLANNSASWQWVAGCGCDAAPYFRIFNPTTQAEKFDPSGDYIRRFVPELSKLPTRSLFTPWLAPKAVLEQASIVLGKTYPYPIVDLKASREQALETYRCL